jgi:carbonic anhydrase
MSRISTALGLCAVCLFTLSIPACSRHDSGDVQDHQHVAFTGSHTSGAAATHGSADVPSPDEAMQRLDEGNARFIAGETKHPHEARTWRAGLESAQHPFATVIGCSDSRVPLELVFDQGFGDLFVIRVAGNLIARDEAGSIEYAVCHLHTPIVAVVGHAHCGAVTAALGTHEEIMAEPVELSDLLGAIHTGMPEIPYSLSKEERVQRGVEANIRHAMAQLHKVASVQEAVERGETRIVGGIYDLHTGKVNWLE